MMDLTAFIQLLLSGLSTGCVYALVAIGFVLSANVSGVINFAQGEYVMLGGLVAASVVDLQLGLPLAIAAAAASGALLGAAQERLTLAPTRHSPHFVQTAITLGVAVVVRGVALLVWGKDPYGMPGFSGDGTFSVLGAIFPWQVAWIWGATALLLLGTFWFLRRTDLGRAVRSCAINEQAARLMGIDTGRITMLVFMGGGLLGALAGAVITPLALASWDVGLDYSVKGFIGALIGGFRSPAIAVVGALSIGAVESLGAGYISSEGKDAITYALLLVYLMVRGGVLTFGRSSLSAASNNGH